MFKDKVNTDTESIFVEIRTFLRAEVKKNWESEVISKI